MTCLKSPNAWQHALDDVLGSHSECAQLRHTCAAQNGHVKRCADEDMQSSVLEIMGTNVSSNYITCPADPRLTLGIKLPILVMIIKNMKKYFTFEVQVLDDKSVRRRFRVSNYQVSSRTVSCGFINFLGGISYGCVYTMISH